MLAIGIDRARNFMLINLVSLRICDIFTIEIFILLFLLFKFNSAIIMPLAQIHRVDTGEFGTGCRDNVPRAIFG